MNGLLFNQGHLEEFLNIHKQNIQSEIDRLPISEPTEFIEQVIESLVHKFQLQAPRLLLDKKYALEPESIKIDGARFFHSYLESGTIAGLKYTIVIPFEGDKGLFQYCGSTFTSVAPRGELYDNELHLIYERPNNWDITNEITRDIDNLQKWLGGVQGVVEGFNNQLVSFIFNVVEQRKRRIEEKSKILGSLGIPIHKKSEDVKSDQTPKSVLATHAEKTVNPDVKMDVFLCHASENKTDYVIPLSKQLKKHNISFWLDNAEIKWGDNITEKINAGIRQSKYVIVFLSEIFIQKNWSNAELSAALSKENSIGKTFVLPLIIGNPTPILVYYPILSAKKYLNWEDGMDSIIQQLQIRLTE